MSKRDGKRNPPAILLGGGIVALSVARSLGKAGIRVFALDAASSPVRSSRYVAPSPFLPEGDQREDWRDILLHHPSPDMVGGVLLPLSDQALSFLVQCRPDLAPHYRVAEGDDRVTLALLDKSIAYQLANRAGIATPYLLPLESSSDLLSGIRELSYPCALQPRLAPAPGGMRMQIIHNADELIYYRKQFRKRGLPILATDLIPASDEGRLSYQTYLDKNGHPMFHFTERTIRQYPTTFGPATHAVTTWDREVARLGLRFLQSAGLRGVGIVEFMRDPRDGVLKLIGCHPRLTSSTELAIRSGLNWPLFLYRRLAGGQMTGVGRYELDVHTLRPLGEWLAFREMRRKERITWREWLSSLNHRHHFLVFRLSDPVPFFTGITPFVSRQLDKIREAGAERLRHFPSHRTSSEHEYEVRGGDGGR